VNDVAKDMCLKKRKSIINEKWPVANEMANVICMKPMKIVKRNEN